MRDSNEPRGCQSCRAKGIQRGLDQIGNDEWLKDKWSISLLILIAIGLWVLFKVVRG